MDAQQEIKYLARFDGSTQIDRARELDGLRDIAVHGDRTNRRMAFDKIALLAGASAFREQALFSLREAHGQRPLETEKAFLRAAGTRAGTTESMVMAQFKRVFEKMGGEFHGLDEFSQIHAVDVAGHAAAHSPVHPANLLLRALEPGNSEVVRQRAAIYALRIYQNTRGPQAASPEAEMAAPGILELRAKLGRNWGVITGLVGSALEGGHATNRLLAAMALHEYPTRELTDSLLTGFREEKRRRKTKAETHPVTLSEMRRALVKFSNAGA